MTESLLSMTGIRKRFGATEALRGVSVELQAGQVLALIGENGAGKSTLMKILSGAEAPDSGRMTLAGEPYSPADPAHGRLAGVGMIYQELNLAGDLSVEDNIMLGQERSRFGLLDRRVQRREVHRVLDLLGHSDLRAERPVRQLSVGLQQLVEIARALVVRSKILVFDEPTSSLSGSDVAHLFEVISRLSRSGIGVIYISHFLEEIRRVCDSYTILRDGESVGGGELEGTREDEIVSRMVGRSLDNLFPTVPHQPKEVVLRLQGITGQVKPSNVSLELRRGEILGIAGLVGAGRTELLRCLFGLDDVRRGEVRVAELRPAGNPSARMQAGLGFVSEDRKGEGLAQIRSIADNLTYSRLQPYSRFGWLRLHRRSRAVGDWMARMQVKARSAEQPVQELSGGNQQKVALARVLHQQADVLLLDEPTRGIDVGTKAEIYRLMGELAAEGKAVIFVSSYFKELLAVCDRVGVMARGRLREVRPVEQWSEETLMRWAVAGDAA